MSVHVNHIRAPTLTPEAAREEDRLHIPMTYPLSILRKPHRVWGKVGAADIAIIFGEALA
jgi:hypothetical protein